MEKEWYSSFQSPDVNLIENKWSVEVQIPKKAIHFKIKRNLQFVEKLNKKILLDTVKQLSSIKDKTLHEISVINFWNIFLITIKSTIIKFFLQKEFIFTEISLLWCKIVTNELCQTIDDTTNI